jgi:hypothetical protein
LQKLLFAVATASALLSATVAFAQPVGYNPTMYGTRAFDTNPQQSASMTSAKTGSGQSQPETGSVSGTVAPAQSRTPRS